MWARRRARAACDVRQPWECGTVWRSSRYPDYWEMNQVVVERPTGLSARALARLSDGLLAGLEHRWVTVEDPDEAVRLRPGFEALGWRVVVLVWMLHSGSPPAGSPRAGEGVVGDVPVVEAVPYDAVAALRAAWHEEDFPGTDPGNFHAHVRERALAEGARVLAVRDGSGLPVGFAEVTGGGAGAPGERGAEVHQVFVTRAQRGRGLGTALTRAAIASALAPRRDLWIGADDEDRPKELYSRLGFTPVWREWQFFRVPGSSAG